MDLTSYEKPKHTFGGIYRGFVEDNNDPEDIGRIKVRIFGIHDIEKTPISSLPWAYPALGLHFSGGYNINNDDHVTNPPKDKINNDLRYNPGSNSKIAGTNDNVNQYLNKVKSSDKFVDERIDPYGNAAGTGGQFVVPKRGNWVFLFFEAGNHMNPIYFAMAPMARDWTTQKSQRSEEISQKVKQITAFKNTFSPRLNNKSTDVGTWADAQVAVNINKPNLEIKEVKDDQNLNRDIYSTTTAQGTTVIIDNSSGNEKIYIIHKNSIEHTDEIGNKKIYIGKSHNVQKGNNKLIPQSLDQNTACNYEVGVEGNHELYVLGEYKVYAKDGVKIQVDGDALIDVKNDIGIVSQSGNVNLLIKNGNLKADVGGNANVNVQKNANIKINKNANLKIGGNLKSTIGGEFDLNVAGNINIKTNANLNMTIGGSTKVKTNSFDVLSPNATFTGTGAFGGNLSTNANLSSKLDTTVGAFAYVVAGINCGGTLVNRGLAELGSPCILHSALIVPGMAPGTGRPSTSITTIPSPPVPPTDAVKED